MSNYGETAVRVEIYDQNYSIRSDGDTAYILELADHVDRKMREIASGSMTVDSLKVAILAALHIADEFFQLKQTQAQMDAQLGSRSAECSEMLDKVLKARETVAGAIPNSLAISLMVILFFIFS